MTDAAHSDPYAVGQVWAYRTRPHEPASTLLIHRIETAPNGEPIFHVSVHDLKVRNRSAPGGFSAELMHLPVSKLTLDASVSSLSATGVDDARYLAGYQT